MLIARIDAGDLIPIAIDQEEKMNRTIEVKGDSWPTPDLELEYQLRFFPDRITKKEHLRAAEIVLAYSRMIEMTRDDRQKVITAIRKEERRRHRWGD
jgi:hypothetical protein